MSEDELDLIQAEKYVELYKSRAGRPTDYKPEFCEALVRHMAQGFSFESFGAQVMACEQTLYNWTKAHPDFLESKRLGTIASLEWFEKRGKRGMGEQFFKPGVWGHLLRNRFRKIGELSYDQRPVATTDEGDHGDGFDTEDDDE